MHRPSKNKLRPRLDALESRALLAGNVTVAFSSGNLVITGDNSSNAVDVFQTSLDNYRVVGLTTGGSATRINSRTGGSFDFSLGSSRYTGDIRVNLNGGNDFVRIRGSSGLFGFNDLDAPDDIEINMGSGTDAVDLRFVEAQRGDVRIDLGTGTGTVVASNVVTGDDFTVFSSLDARVTANLDNLTVRDLLDLDLSNSVDIVNITNSATSTLVAALYNGNDRLNIKRTRVSRMSSLDGGSGTDDLNLFRNSPSSLTRRDFRAPTASDITY